MTDPKEIPNTGDIGVGMTKEWHIAVISGSVLALELAFIRLIPAEVRAISYFSNLILMATFFGLGLGCILSKSRNMSFCLPLGLFAVAGFITWGRGIVIYEQAVSVHYWLQYEQPEGLARKLELFPAAVIAFAGSALPFVALGQSLARTMDKFPRLAAYGWDILGSIAGTLLFVASSYFGMPPWVWPLFIMILHASILGTSWKSSVSNIAAGAIFLTFVFSPYDYKWSPYYFVQYAVEKDGLRVWVNSSFHQLAIDFSDKDGQMQQRMMKNFGMPYRIYRSHHDGKPPRRVLILGAGTGNDVVVALANDAEEVVAVEIDPAILSLGYRLNKSSPYSDKRVKTVVDDARHFLQSSRDTFDMIVFGTLDSQTLLSNYANLRLENYVYTREAFREVRNRLSVGGMTAAYYSAFKPWLAGRLYKTVSEVFENSCQGYKNLTNPFLFDSVIIAARDIPDFHSSEQQKATSSEFLPSTDDWPFLYLQYPTIAPVYSKLILTVILLTIGVFCLLRRLEKSEGFHSDFLFLGMGFTLMEAAAVVRLALLYGSTWIVNAVVFASVLLMIFCANFLVAKGWSPRIRIAWIGLIIAIAANYFVPIRYLLQFPLVIRILASGVLIGMPVFFASVCFSTLFAKQSSVGYALGINLIGAMSGGLIEYVSMLTGMRSVWLVILLVYLLAWFGSGLRKTNLIEST